ncbi:preprotein translocase subunit YajC [Eubacteriales bacterium OttesenSCG-928-N14]|nr:preprotein translocase subunit YajC [Eubacteriales bacterium OttesenSCG-928-N14]
MEFFATYWWLIVIAIVLFAVFIFFRRSRRSMENIQEEREQVKVRVQPGSHVTMDSGMLGVVKEVREKTYMIEIAPGVVCEFEKYGVVFIRDQQAQKQEKADKKSESTGGKKQVSKA